MAENTDNTPIYPEQASGSQSDAPQSCPFGHKGWVYKRYNEYVCGRCGVRIVNFPGVRVG